MGTLTKPYTFVAAQSAVASQVNANFDSIFGWINGGSAIWADATVAFTGIPVLPASDPFSVNQATRKSYVDAQVAAVQAQVTPLVNANVSPAGMGGTSPFQGPAVTNNKWTVRAGVSTGASTDANGDIVISFTAFPNGMISAVASIIIASGTGNAQQAAVGVWAPTASSFKARIYNPSNGNAYTTGTWGVSWNAIGW